MRKHLLQDDTAGQARQDDTPGQARQAGSLPDRPVCKFPNNRENLPEFQTTNDGAVNDVPFIKP